MSRFSKGRGLVLASELLYRRPAACAYLTGETPGSAVAGVVSLYGVPGGTLLAAEVCGLPVAGEGFSLGVGGRAAALLWADGGCAWAAAFLPGLSLYESVGGAATIKKAGDPETGIACGEIRLC